MQQEIKTTKESNFELLRIVSMFFIVLWHVIIHGKVLENSSNTLHYLLQIILFILITHVNSFLMITGYFQYNKKFSIKKILKIVLQLWFYNFIIYSIFHFFNIIKLDMITFCFKASFFNTSSSYWFITNYIILYLISPFLNKIILNTNKKQHIQLIMVLSLIYFISPIFTLGNFIYNNGYNIQQFIIFYFIGSFISKYKIDNKIFNNTNLIQKRIIYISIILFCVLFNFCFFNTMTYLYNNISNFKTITGYFSRDYYIYSNIIVVIQTITLFMLFQTFKFSSKVVNTVSRTTFGIYLIHEHEFIKKYIYKLLKIDLGIKYTNLNVIFKCIYVSVIIFLACAIIERIRILLLEDRKWYKKLVNEIGDFLEKVFEINCKG